ncbi:MAG TPA: hypothetical protein VIL34_08215 [Actinopolymorphaceae bacterium]|jgi:hypothetical protein
MILPRLLGAVVVASMLTATLGAPAATASYANPDEETQHGRTYERPSERVLYDKRVRDGRVSGNLTEARRYAAVNYAVVWWRITHYDPRTIKQLKSAAALGRYPWRHAANPPLVDIDVLTARQMRRDNPELYRELRQHGLEDDDIVAQMVARSTPPRKGQRGYHSEELLLRSRYAQEYVDQQIKRAVQAGRTVDDKLIKEIEKSLKPGSGVVYTPKDLIYGVTEREPCSYRGSPACYRYSGILDYVVPYGPTAERRKAQGRLARAIQDQALNDLALIIRRTYVRDAVTKALRPFQQPGELPGRRYDYEKEDPRRDPPGLERALDPSSQDTGGIDFSTLELRYVAAGSSGDGMRYAFSARRGGSADSQTPLAGAQSVNRASDAFFVWLALPESRFWVNLNPNEPDRIAGRGLEKTDVGRIMLEADLELKKTVGKLIHPRTQLGKRFWSSLWGENGRLCFSSRAWIVPQPATVYDADGELYIIDAPLDVKVEQEYIHEIGTRKYRGCPYQPAAIEEHNTEVYRRLVIPRLVEAVNNAPEYAALRQIYLSRIAAQWYRERSQSRRMEFSHLIDSGDVDAWPSTRRWSPDEIYGRYVQSYEKGEFRTGGYTYGGVVFTDVPRREVTKAEFKRSWPGAKTTVDRALDGVATDEHGGHLWIGGTSSEPIKSRRATKPAQQEGAGWLQAATAAAVGVGLVVAFLVFLTRRQRQPG